MCFDGSGGHAPPSARHLFPDSAGRSVRLFRFAFRLGQRGIAPLCARPLDLVIDSKELNETANMRPANLMIAKSVS